MNSKCVALGIDVGGTSIKYGLIEFDGREVYALERPTKIGEEDSSVRVTLVKIIEETIAVAKAMGAITCCIGVGVPGLVSNSNIILTCDNIPELINLPLADIVQNSVGLSTCIYNDADAAAFSEFQVECQQGDTALFVSLGTGIGGALYIHGQAFQGQFGMGGELGVFPMSINGKVQNWEDIASTQALLKHYRQRLDPNVYPDHLIDGHFLVERYVAHDPIAIQCINEFLHYLALGLAGYINVFNPARVIIGGGFSTAITTFMPALIDHIKHYVIPQAFKSVEIIAAKSGNKAGFKGAALLALKHTRSALSIL
ncbi:ROK family protein [Chryseolinea lacunae]|uniref:ROK family protein n=1 Tax=Chryseolinea lacunae TaxID=2801331 RepID=A0ABS1L2D2_9BACT|nr:ROK family protein [Chryseolinea lacunae]MBL0745804.1 ROK family protein [Chryseolinea lacunae]